MTIKAFLKAHPVFRYEAFSAYMREQEGAAREASIRQRLNYYHKTGKVSQIRRSLYAVNPEFSVAPAIDPYLIAAYATPEAILAYHTALEFYGLAYTTFTELVFLVNAQARDFAFQGTHYRPVVQPKTLIDQQQTTYEVDTVERQGLPIRITSLERTFVDVLDRSDLAGGWEEVIRSLDHIVNINIKHVVDYALLLNKPVTIAKVGYFLEQLPDYLKIEKRQVNRLLTHIPQQPYYLEPKEKGQGKGKYVAKWQLIVPEIIIQRGWEEPDSDAL
ncbi:MAG: transcriptional regulator [Gammaproteobacteria bacterium CG12_big_fil_rev_8_21_14_0_65_46_12]|nr:MAG: transcriptional regulator [Gammaproteobacteria bacterium CG12_big_fil_rev_8_21_14_0_65_46_12]